MDREKIIPKYEKGELSKEENLVLTVIRDIEFGSLTVKVQNGKIVYIEERENKYKL